MKKLFKKYIDIAENIKKLPKNTLGLNQLQQLLNNGEFFSSETKTLVSSLRIFFDNYIASFSGLMIPVKKSYIAGIGLGQLLFRREPSFGFNPEEKKLAALVEIRLNEIISEKAKINKLKWEKIQLLRLEGKGPEEIKKDIVIKELAQLKESYKQTLHFLNKYKKDNFIITGRPLSELAENERLYLFALAEQINLAKDIKYNRKPLVLFCEKLSLQDFSEIAKCPEQLQAIIVTKKLSPGLSKIFEHLKIPIIQIEQSLLSEYQGTPIAVYSFDKQQQVIINPGKDIRTEVLNYQKLFKQNELLRITNELQNLPVTVDKYHMRLLVDLGSAETDFPEEIKWMIAENADGAGNIYTEQFITRYIQEFDNWSTYTLKEKQNSSLVLNSLYPALKMVSEQINLGYPREKFQLHFRAFNIKKSKASGQTYAALIGVDTKNEQQPYELELLKRDPERLVFPFLEALIISLQKIAEADGLALVPLVSYSLPNMQTIEDIALYEKWFKESYQRLTLENNGLLEKGVMFGSFITDDQYFERFVEELYQKKIKYFLTDSSRWAADTLYQIVGEDYKLSEYDKLPLEISGGLLVNMDKNLRVIYNKNEALPPNEKLRLINIGVQPREYPLAALYFSRTISVPLANIKTLTAKIRMTAYQHDEHWHEQNMTVSYLLSNNKLLFDSRLDRLSLRKLLQDNIADYMQMDNKINKRVQNQKLSAKRKQDKKYEETIIFTSTNVEQLRKEQENKNESTASVWQLPENILQADEQTFQINLGVSFPKGLHLRPSTALAMAFADLAKYTEIKILAIDRSEPLTDFYCEEFGENFERFNPTDISSWVMLQLFYGDTLKLAVKATNLRRIKLIKTVLAGLANYFNSGDCASPLEY